LILFHIICVGWTSPFQGFLFTTLLKKTIYKKAETCTAKLFFA
jgi:hypothetical protein